MTTSTVIALIGAVASLLAAVVRIVWIRRRRLQEKAAKEIQNLQGYKDMREALDNVEPAPDADTARQWLRERARKP